MKCGREYGQGIPYSIRTVLFNLKGRDKETVIHVIYFFTELNQLCINLSFTMNETCSQLPLHVHF